MNNYPDNCVICGQEGTHGISHNFKSWGLCKKHFFKSLSIKGTDEFVIEQLKILERKEKLKKLLS